MTTTDFRVYWSVLQDRAMYDKAAQPLLRLATHNGFLGYGLIAPPYMRTDIARNVIVREFMRETTHPDSILVMLDADHDHPVDTVERLVNVMQVYNGTPPELDGRRMGVLGALYYRRAAPFDPLFFKRAPDGNSYMSPGDFEDGMVYECDHVGTGAIAIRRWVFEELSAYAPLYFRYAYFPSDPPEEQASEDTFFAFICEQNGISHFVHTGIVSAHLRLDVVDRKRWEDYKRQLEGNVYFNAPVMEVEGVS